MKYVLLFVRLLLGGVLLWAGLVKARQPFEFLSTVYSYQLVGPVTGILVAAALPWLEIVVGCCLLSGIVTEGSLVVALLLTGTFTVAIASAWHRGLGISCGCFGGASEATIDALTVLRALGLALLSLLGLVIAVRLGSASASTELKAEHKLQQPTSRRKQTDFPVPGTWRHTSPMGR